MHYMPLVCNSKPCQLLPAMPVTSFLFVVSLFCVLRHETELHQVFHGGAGWFHRSSFHWWGGGVGRCGAGTAKGHESEFHERAGKRGGNGSLAGGPRDEFCLQRLQV